MKRVIRFCACGEATDDAEKRALDASESDSLDDPRQRITQAAGGEPLQRAIVVAGVIDDVPPVDGTWTFALASRRAEGAGMTDEDIPRKMEGKSHGLMESDS